MSTNITTFYVQQYAKVLNELVQQKTSRLRKWATEDKYVGQAGSPVEQVGQVAMQPVTQRYGPMQRVDAPTARRWVYPSDYDLPQLFDNFDKLRLLIDPKGRFVKNAHNAANRQYDDLLIQALSGIAQTGVSGTTPGVTAGGQHHLRAAGCDLAHGFHGREAPPGEDAARAERSGVRR